MSGMSRKFQPAKFDELIVYLSERCDMQPSWGRTKLFKLLYFCDFTAYRELNSAITWATYSKMPNGPVPKEGYPALERLKKSRRLDEITRDIGDYREFRPVALDKAKVDSFTPSEVSVIERTLSDFGGLNATQLSEISHNEQGWRFAHPNEVIPYFTALRSVREPTAEEIDYVRALVAE